MQNDTDRHQHIYFQTRFGLVGHRQWQADIPKYHLFEKKLLQNWDIPVIMNPPIMYSANVKYSSSLFISLPFN